MYSLIEKTDSYLEFQDNNTTVLVPTSQGIIVNEENNVSTLKTMQCRKNVLSFTEE